MDRLVGGDSVTDYGFGIYLKGGGAFISNKFHFSR